MDADFEDVWAQAQNQYMSRLKPKSIARLESITCQQQLLAQTQHLSERYNNRLVTRLLTRANAFVATLQSFSDLIQEFVHSAPGCVGLIWGLLFLGIELSVRHASILERTVDTLDQYHRALPRFHLYLRRFGSRQVSERLRRSLVDYYAELIATCQDIISFAKRSPIANLIVNPFRPSRNSLNDRASRLRDLTFWVDREAEVADSVATETRQNAQHHELLTHLKPVSMYVGPLPFHYLPVIRNPAFHGREHLLSLLQQCLRPGEDSASLLAASVSGLGGVGKTQIALEFAYRNINAYDAIFWISSETAEKIAEAVAHIAFGLGLARDGVKQQQDQLRERVKQYWLNVSTRAARKPIKWLIIFDNVENPRALQDYWPQGCDGSVIMTSRNTDSCRNFIKPSSQLAVEAFSKQEGQTFLTNVMMNVTQCAIPSEEIHAAELISDTLGHLPLALNLISTYVTVNGLSYSRFLATHPRFERKFLFRGQPSYWDAQSYQQSINDTWTLTFSGLDPNARFVLDTLAFLDPDGVFVDFFSAKDRDKLVDEGPDAAFTELDSYLENPLAHTSELDEAVGSLLRLSLVSRGRDNCHIACHRLVQIATINSMEQQHRCVVFNRAVYLLNAVFPQQHDGKPMYNQWRICEEYCRHVFALLDTFKWLQTDLGFPILLSEIAARCAWYFFEKGRFDAAENLVEQAESICFAALETNNHPGFTSCYVKEEITHLINVKATTALQKCEYGRGLALCQDIRRLREDYQRSGNAYDEKWLAFANGNIAVALMGVNEPAQALNILNELLSREDTATNRDIYLNNKCICLILLERYDDALQICEKAIELINAKRGEASEGMAIALFYLGKIRWNRGDPDQAYDAISRCFRLRQAIMPDHHFTGLTAHKLGEIVRERGDLQAAIVLFKEALPILEHSEYHPGGYCRTAFALCEVLTRIGDIDQAGVYRSKGENRAQNFDAQGLGIGAKSYEQFVGYPHR